MLYPMHSLLLYVPYTDSSLLLSYSLSLLLYPLLLHSLSLLHYSSKHSHHLKLRFS